TSVRGCPINSMPCCTSTKRERSSLSSASRLRAAKSRRRFPPAFEWSAPMPSRDIPREKWVPFLDSFSRQHERWLVNMEVVTDGLGVHKELREKRLIGVSADLKSRGSGTISIIAGDRSDDHVNHIINGPTRVALEETEEGAHKG